MRAVVKVSFAFHKPPRPLALGSRLSSIVILAAHRLIITQLNALTMITLLRPRCAILVDRTGQSAYMNTGPEALRLTLMAPEFLPPEATTALPTLILK